MGWFRKAIENSGIKDWIAIATALVLIITTISAGLTSISDNRERSKENRQRVIKLEKDAAVNQANFDNIDKKLNNIEQKIDKIIEREIEGNQ